MHGPLPAARCMVIEFTLSKFFFVPFRIGHYLSTMYLLVISKQHNFPIVRIVSDYIPALNTLY